MFFHQLLLLHRSCWFVGVNSSARGCRIVTCNHFNLYLLTTHANLVVFLPILNHQIKVVFQNQSKKSKDIHSYVQFEFRLKLVCGWYYVTYFTDLDNRFSWNRIFIGSGLGRDTSSMKSITTVWHHLGNLRAIK